MFQVPRGRKATAITRVNKLLLLGPEGGKKLLEHQVVSIRIIDQHPAFFTLVHKETPGS